MKMSYELPTLSAAPRPKRLSAIWARLVPNRRFGYAVVDQGVFALTNLATSIMVSHNCAQRDFGVFILGIRLIDVIVTLLNVFIWAPYTMTLPSRTDDDRRRFLGSVIVHQLCLSFIFAGLIRALAFIPMVLADGTRIDQVVSAVSICIPFFTFREFSRRMYFAELDLEGVLRQDIISAVLQVAAFALILRFGNMTPDYALYTIAFCNAIAVLTWAIGPMRASRISRAAVVNDLRNNLKIGKWLFGSNLAVVASSQMGAWLLGIFSGPTATASLAVCEFVVNICRTALTSVQNLLGPQIARTLARATDYTSLKQMVRKWTLHITFGTALFSVGILLFGGKLITLVYGSRFTGLGLICFVLSINLLILAAGSPASYALTTSGNTSLEFVSNAIGLAVQLALSLFLVKAYGLWGICLATTLAYLIVLSVRYAFYRSIFSRVAS